MRYNFNPWTARVIRINDLSLYNLIVSIRRRLNLDGPRREIDMNERKIVGEGQKNNSFFRLIDAVRFMIYNINNNNKNNST